MLDNGALSVQRVTLDRVALFVLAKGRRGLGDAAEGRNGPASCSERNG